MITYTDGSTTNLGRIIGKDGKDGAKGEKGDAGQDGKNGTDGKDGQNGADGIGVAKTEVNAAGELVITYTDGSTTNLGRIVGKDGKDGVKGEKGDAGQDGQNGTDGKDGQNGADGKDGRGIAAATVNGTGELVITFSDATELNLGKIKGEKGDKGEPGVAGQDGNDGKDGVGIANVRIADSGILTVTLTNGTNLHLGNIKGADGIGITRSVIGDDGHLVLTYSDGNSTDLGLVVGKNGADGIDGKPGADGVGIKDVTVSGDGVLIVTLSTGEVKTLGNIKGEKGNKGEPGKDGRGIVKTEVVDGKLTFYYTDGTTQTHDLGDLSGDPNEKEILVYSLLADGTYGVMAGGMAKYEANIEIPATHDGIAVTQILSSGFIGLPVLHSVTIPESVVAVGDDAFKDCSALQTVHLSDNVALLGKYAFYGCGNLTDIVLPQALTAIKPYTFAQCTALNTITIHSNIKTIGAYAFAGAGLETAIFENMNWAPEEMLYHATTSGYCEQEIIDKSHRTTKTFQFTYGSGTSATIYTLNFHSSQLVATALCKRVNVRMNEKGYEWSERYCYFSFDAYRYEWHLSE